MLYRNQVGQEMLPDRMFERLFPGITRKTVAKPAMALIKEHLAQFKIPCPKPPGKTPKLEVEIPDLLGDDIERHFEVMAGTLLGDLESRLGGLFKGIPEPPKEFSVQAGWTRYVEGSLTCQVEHPLEKTLVFDAETLVKRGNWPVIMVAVSTEAWYIWLHESICIPNMIDFEPQMVPMGTDKTLIGHNVGFDRVRLSCEYSLTDTGNVFLDTMSMHTATSGLSAEQRKAYAAISYKPPHVKKAITWYRKGAPKNLMDCYNFHVHNFSGPYNGPTGTGTPMHKDSKGTRDIFVEANSPSIIHMRLHELVSYAVEDVWRTWKLASVLYYKFRRSNPSMVTLLATLIMGSSKLPVTDGWENWKIATDGVFFDTQRRMEEKLNSLATDIHSRWLSECSHDLKALNKSGDFDSMDWLKGTSIEGNVFHERLDWTPAKSGKNKGHALWFRKCKGKVTSKSRVAPYLLGLYWSEKPLFYTKEYGWVFQVADKDEAMGLDLLEYGSQKVCRVPHKDGGDHNCGNPLAKDYIGSFENGTLTASSPEAESILNDAASSSYWLSVRKRVHSQFCLKASNPYGKDCNLILPQLEVMGTGTRRAVERLWLTVCGSKVNKIGSELKSRVQAPEGWNFVAADFDAQESLVGSRLADSKKGIIGSTAMSYTVISGNKADGTDGHSQLRDHLNNKLASIRGIPLGELKDKISRTGSKAPRFAMLYGSGERGLSGTFKKEKKEWTDSECRQQARAALEMLRGKKVQGPGGQMYHGGTDSDAYNFMLDKANEACPKTPMLKSAITTALRRSAVGKDYITSRTNWVIQSSGVDLLHATLVGFRYLVAVHEIPAVFLFSYHDELLTACKIGHEKETAQALNMAHLWSQSLLSYSLGLDDVSANNAFFSGTNIDTCFRKEVKDSQVTPSNDFEPENGVSLGPDEVFEGGTIFD